MLATEFDNSKKKLNDTDVDFLSISWSSCLIRFSEKLQIIDVQDCMNVMYETHGSAKSAQSKYFSADLANTERVLECEAGKLLLKVKWKDAARNRLAISVQFMQKFCEKICKMARASNLASKLDVEVLTVRNLCEEYVAENTGDNSTDTKLVTTGEITDKVVEFADPRIVTLAANRSLLAGVAESDARVGRAGHQARLEAIECEEKQKISYGRLIVACEKITQERETNARENLMRKEEKERENLMRKIKDAESLGMDDKAAALKRKVADMLDA